MESRYNLEVLCRALFPLRTPSKYTGKIEEPTPQWGCVGALTDGPVTYQCTLWGSTCDVSFVLRGGLLEGKGTVRDPERILLECGFNRGKLEGEATLYGPEGHPRARCGFRGDLLEGDYTTYRPWDHTMEMRVCFKRGREMETRLYHRDHPARVQTHILHRGWDGEESDSESKEDSEERVYNPQGQLEFAFTCDTRGHRTYRRGIEMHLESGTFYLPRHSEGDPP